MLKTVGIQELETASGLPRRTIHFYVKEGLIPPPDGLGRGARYGWGHIDALSLISALKQSTHLRLEGIREILARMSPGEMRTWALDIKQGSRSAGELAAMHAMGAGDAAGAVDALSLREGPDAGDDSPDTPVAGELFENLIDEPEAEDGTPVRMAMPLSSPKGSTRSLFSRLSSRKSRKPETPESWERVRLADDLEIHFRDDGDKARRVHIEALLEIAREMFKR